MTDGPSFVTNNAMIVAPSDRTVDRHYLYFALSAANMATVTTGTSQPQITIGRLSQLPIRLPPHREQRRIGGILLALQNAHNAAGTVASAGRATKDAVVRQLFRYGPTRLSNLSTVKSQETSYGTFPSHWEIRTIGEIADTTSGGTPDRGRSDYYEGTLPWVKSGELRDREIAGTSEAISDEALASSNAKTFPSGTLLMAMYGATAGMLGILTIPAATNQAVCALIPTGVSRDYLYYALLLRRNALLGERIGGAQPNLSQRLIRAFSIPVPPAHEQDEIARILRATDGWLRAMESRTSAVSSVFSAALDTLFRAAS